jgi:hypothetical protein
MTATGMTIPGSDNVETHYTIFFIALVVWIGINLIEDKDK